jgi:site-specific DNA-methyltransferase (adenine-specific)
MKNYKLILGDCLEKMKEIEDESIDLLIVDPPYGSTTMEWDKIIPFNLLWPEIERVVKPKANIIIFGSQPFTSLLIASKIDWFRYELIWNKNKCGSPGLAKKRPMKVHENIIVFSKKPGSIYNPQMEEGEPYKRTSKNPDGYVGKANNHKYGLKPRKSFENTGTRYPKSIINISRDFSAQQQVHPTQKPVPLMEWLIKTYSNENDLILDNCMGSGTTGVAALNLNRKFIGIEKEKEYFDISEKRIEEILENKNDKALDT